MPARMLAASVGSAVQPHFGPWKSATFPREYLLEVPRSAAFRQEVSHGAYIATLGLERGTCNLWQAAEIREPACHQ